MVQYFRHVCRTWEIMQSCNGPRRWITHYKPPTLHSHRPQQERSEIFQHYENGGLRGAAYTITSTELRNRRTAVSVLPLYPCCSARVCTLPPLSSQHRRLRYPTGTVVQRDAGGSSTPVTPISTLGKLRHYHSRSPLQVLYGTPYSQAKLRIRLLEGTTLRHTEA